MKENFVTSFSRVQGKEELRRMHTIKEFTSLIANDVKGGNLEQVKKLAASAMLDNCNVEKFLGGDKNAWYKEKLAQAERNLQFADEAAIKESKEYSLLSSKNKMFEVCRNYLPCIIKQTADQADATKAAVSAYNEAKAAAKQAAADAEAAAQEAAKAAKEATTEAKVLIKEQKQAEAQQAAAKAEAAQQAEAAAKAAAAAAGGAGSLRFAKEAVIGYRCNSLTEEETAKYENSSAFAKMQIQVGTEFKDTLQYFVRTDEAVDFSLRISQRKKAFAEKAVSSVYYLKGDKLCTMKESDFINYDTLFVVLSYHLQAEKAAAKAAAAQAAAKASTLQSIAEAEAQKMQEYNFLVSNIEAAVKLPASAIKLPTLIKQVTEAEHLRNSFNLAEEAAQAVQIAQSIIEAAKQQQEEKRKAKQEEKKAKKEAEKAAAAKEAAQAAEAAAQQDAAQEAK